MTAEPTGDVDRDFVAYHRGAIDIARAELEYGQNEELRRLARDIIVEQEREMLAQQLVELLVDVGTAFLEMSPLVANGLYGADVHSASIVTGVGRIAGRECVIVANDTTIKGGTYYPMTVKKHLRAQNVARQNNLPCIYIVDSGGAFPWLLNA